MAEHRHNDDRDDEDSRPQAPFDDSDQGYSKMTDASGMNYMVDNGADDYENDPQRFYFDGYDQENNPEEDDFDDDLDEDFVEIPDEEIEDLAEPESTTSDEEPVEESVEVDEESEFDDLDADENIYGGEDEI